MKCNTLGVARNLYAAMFVLSLLASAATLGTVLVGFGQLAESGRASVTQLV